MHICLQFGARYGGERPMAAVWPVRCCPERQGDSRPADQQMQGLRLRNDDQLRRSTRGDPIAQRLYAWQPRPASLVQDGRLSQRPPQQSLTDKAKPKRSSCLSPTNSHRPALLADKTYNLYITHILNILHHSGMCPSLSSNL